MQYNNLNRAAEIANELPQLDKARKALASENSHMEVIDATGKGIRVPDSVRLNVINILNCEYERLREEVKRL